MKVISGIGDLKPALHPSSVAIGVFDGVHCGHQFLIQQSIMSAKAMGGQSVVVTFYPHPVHVLRPDIAMPYLISLDHRLKRLEECGVDVCLVIEFTPEFASMDPEVFVKSVLVDGLKAKHIFVGDDFRFGKNRAGCADVFHACGLKYDFEFHPIIRVQKEGDVISSTRIRELILAGDLSDAAAILGRPVSVMGVVVHGDGRGQALGFPTINLELGNDIWPPNGVYVVEVEWQGKTLPGMANLGRRPSFKVNDCVQLEVHLFDFKQSLYDQIVVVNFYDKIRDEQSFDSQEKLIEQIKRDEAYSRQYFQRVVSR